MKKRLYLGARIMSVLSVVLGLLVLPAISQQGAQVAQAPLCGFMWSSTWDCDDMGQWYWDLQGCGSSLCDDVDPVCTTITQFTVS